MNDFFYKHPWILAIPMAVGITAMFYFAFEHDQRVVAAAREAQALVAPTVSDEPAPGPNATCNEIVTHAEATQCRSKSGKRREECLRKMDRMFIECMATKNSTSKFEAES